MRSPRGRADLRRRQGHRHGGGGKGGTCGADAAHAQGGGAQGGGAAAAAGRDRDGVAGSRNGAAAPTAAAAPRAATAPTAPAASTATAAPNAASRPAADTVKRTPADSARLAAENRSLSYGELVGKSGGLTPLLFAVRQGHSASVLALLEAGADVNQVSAGTTRRLRSGHDRRAVRPGDGPAEEGPSPRWRATPGRRHTLPRRSTCSRPPSRSTATRHSCNRRQGSSP
ncbi:MAG: ankyrin repeat domain-containing protein [Gemmatimonadetes bacterium]|nr:ankyrin repeat domain-containing protein [Gemmatimonadota bacterium]